jgi:hypothetical protein
MNSSFADGFDLGLKRMQRDGLLDEAPARKSVSTARVRVERFEVE